MESLTQPAPVVAAPVPSPRSPVPRRRVLLLLLAALTTAGLLWLSYFPMNVGGIAWFALVPFLALVRTTARARVVYPLGWIAGLVFYFPALQWMRVADPRMYFTWIGLAFYCSLYFPLGLFFIRTIDRRTRLPLVLTAPVVWAALEYFRSEFCTGFSWYLLGHTQHDFLPVIQFADLTGAYGVSFLVAAVNAVLFEALYRSAWFRTRFAGGDAPAPLRPAALLVQFGVVVGALVAAVGYGEWRLGQDAFTPGPRVALVQGSVPQQIRNDVNLVDWMATHYLALTDMAAAQDRRPDLIVWPESSFPGAWYDTKPGAEGRAPAAWNDAVEKDRSLFHEVVQPWKTDVLLGLDSAVMEADGHKESHNSALLLDPEAHALGRYDKIHCVPFGEYVPLRDVFPWMRVFAPYDFDYSVTPGRNATYFPLDVNGQKYTFGVAICYEDTDPDRTRPYAGDDNKPSVDFLLNISNDGWFDGTSEHDEHLAICRFRAIECRRSIGRAVNMGVSAVIDGDGRVLAPEPVAGTEWDQPAVRALIDARIEHLPADERPAVRDLFPSDRRAAVLQFSPSRGGGPTLPTARWAEFKKTPCVLIADMPIDRRVSLYAFWGDWLPWGCWAVLAVGVVLAFVRRRCILPVSAASENERK